MPNTMAALREINQVTACTERVTKFKEAFLAAPPGISAARSRLFTEAWKQTEGQPRAMRVAKAHRHVLNQVPIFIHEDELIVGSYTEYVRGTQAPMEWIGELLEPYLAAERPMMGRVPGVLAEEDRKSLRQDLDYWRNKTIYSAAHEACVKAIGSVYDDILDARIFQDQPATIYNSPMPDWGRVLAKGMNGLIAEARQAIQNLDFSSRDDVKRLHFMEAVIVGCEGAIEYGLRHARLSRDLAEKEHAPERKSELLRIAATCEQVPANGARTFREAVQSLWFIFLVSRFEAAGYSEVLARVDQYLYPYYDKDIREGVMTRQEAAEILACLWVKLVALQSLKDGTASDRTQGSEFINVTLGGVTADGRDATNELTFLILEVERQLKFHQPHITFRYHDGLGDEILFKALETERDIGAGIPQFMNDKVLIPRFLSVGVPLEVAREWVGFD